MTMSMNMRSGFIAIGLRTPSSPFSAAPLEAVLLERLLPAKTSVGESSMIRMSAFADSPSFSHVRLDRPQQLILVKGFVR